MQLQCYVIKLLDLICVFFYSINEEFLEHCLEGALSIEVYGHRSAGFATTTKWDERRQLAKSLADRLVCFIFIGQCLRFETISRIQICFKIELYN